MKKDSNNGIRITHSHMIEDMVMKHGLPYPFDRDLLSLLKKENHFEQEYYYLERDDDYAFFTLYKNKMNIFTFGKLKCNFNLNVIGFPCSLSSCGYVTNNEQMMLDYIKKIKGAKLVLNVTNPIPVKNMTVGKTLPTCLFNCEFDTVEEYMDSLRSQYRRRIRIANEKCKDINAIMDNDADVYNLYLNTYNKSDYKLEKLERGFFENVDADKIVFMKNDAPIGFVLLKKVQNQLIFMLCGMDYNYKTTDLYYHMLYNIVKYAIEQKCKVIDFGQTSEETKMKFGAFLEEKYFYAHHTNFILNGLVRLGKGLLEYKYKFPQFRVFKEEQQ